MRGCALAYGDDRAAERVLQRDRDRDLAGGPGGCDLLGMRRVCVGVCVGVCAVCVIVCVNVL